MAVDDAGRQMLAAGVDHDSAPGSFDFVCRTHGLNAAAMHEHGRVL